MQIPQWLGESRLMSGLSADERRHVEQRQQQANASLAPYIGLACLIFFSAMVIVDIERHQQHLFNASISGLGYGLVAACHVILALSIVPALALKSQILVALNRQSGDGWNLNVSERVNFFATTI